MEADNGQGGEEGGQGVDGVVLIERENQTRLKTFLSLSASDPVLKQLVIPKTKYYYYNVEQCYCPSFAVNPGYLFAWLG